MLKEIYPESYQGLFAVFNAIHPLSEELKSAIMSNSHIAQVKRKTTLLSAGENSNTIYFIVAGGARVYYLDKDGKQTNTWFLFENELLISVYGFFTGQPSFEYIETLEDTTLIVVKREKLDEIYLQFMEFNFIGRKLTEYYYIRNEIQANELRMLSAKERYETLLKRSPQLFQRVSLGHIEEEFQLVQTKALAQKNSSYDINNYNCTNYALDVFNIIRDANHQIEINDWVGSSGFNYGKTPNGLYNKLLTMKENGYTNISKGEKKSPAKKGGCN